MRFYFILIVMLIAVRCISQTKDWSPDSPLVWNDFRTVDTVMYFDAFTAVDFDYKVTIIGDSAIVRFAALFNKQRSIVKLDSKTFDGLQHEQIHFSISEICTRLYKKELLSLNAVPKTYFPYLFNKYFKMSEYLDTKYDEETNHSINEIKQKEWNIKIEKQLDSLKAYSKKTIKVKILEPKVVPVKKKEKKVW